MFELIAIPMAIAAVCTLGYVGSKILLFGLVKPEDVDSDCPAFKPQKGTKETLPARKPVVRSLPSDFKRVSFNSRRVLSTLGSQPRIPQASGALARQSFTIVLPAMDCDRVTSNLLIGSYPLDRKEVEALRAAGITAILSLQTEEDLGERGIRWQAEAALATNLTFQSVPVTDFDTTDLQLELPNCVLVLDRMLKAGHTVYLHCTAGLNRSPTVAAAYLHWCLAWPLERAVGHVREVRDCSPNLEAIRGARWPWVEPGACG